MVETRDYYDALAGYYKYIDKDWEAGVARQAVVLDSVIREFFGPTARHILDTVWDRYPEPWVSPIWIRRERIGYFRR